MLWTALDAAADALDAAERHPGLNLQMPAPLTHLDRDETLVVIVNGGQLLMSRLPQSRSPVTTRTLANYLDALDAIAGESTASEASACGLTAAEQVVLEAGGVARATPPEVDELATSMVAYSRLLETALSVEEAGVRLGVQASRIRQRLSGRTRTLFGFKSRGAWRLPVAQFTDSGAVPGIEQVVSKLPDHLHPLEFEGWFTAPDPDLAEAAELPSVSPRQWLMAGKEPSVVGSLAEQLHRWL